MKIIDHLSCPNCGCPHTDGKPCNLRCRREWAEKQQPHVREAKHARMGELVRNLCPIEPQPIVMVEHQSEARPAKHARMRGLVHNLCPVAPEPIILDFLGD
jgi:hypothetical protein